MDFVDSVCADLEAIRQNRPLVHSMTNYVVMNETANAVLCLGGLPIMAHAIEEVAEMVGIAGALVLNIGTLQPDWIEAMIVAGKRANELGIPIVLDPVGAGATKLRTDSTKRILNELKVSIFRGNKGEVAALAGVESVVRGVESISASASTEEVAERFVKAWGCCTAITGAVDVVTDGTRIAHIGNGHEMMAKLVGTGCMSDVIIGAFAAVNKDPFAAACGALVTFGIAGEMAAEVSGDRPGTFHVELYNALYAVSAADITKRAKLTTEQATA
jgi:hydroxyethylthiazole kinase